MTFSHAVTETRSAPHAGPRSLYACLVLGASLALLSIFSIASGSHQIELPDLVLAVFHPAHAAPDNAHIVWDIRLPRVCLAILVGAMLGMAGAAMQSLTRNDLAEPGLTGVKEGSSLAIVATIILAPAMPLAWRPFIGMVGGLISVLLVLSLAHNLPRLRFVLVGIGMSWTFAAALSLLLVTANVRDVQTALLWLAGSLHTASSDYVMIAAPVALAGLILLLLTARESDVGMIGDAAALGLGVNLKRHATIRLLSVVVLTATSVTCAGSLGFIGLMAPHAARFLVGRQDAALTIGSALFGALLVVIADSIGRLAFAPLQIPTGIVIASVGAPLILFLLWMRRDEI